MVEPKQDPKNQLIDERNVKISHIGNLKMDSSEQYPGQGCVFPEEHVFDFEVNEGSKLVSIATYRWQSSSPPVAV